MQHQRGDVPGPTTKGGVRPEGSALPGERATEPQPSPPPPLGYGEGSSTTPISEEPSASPDKYYNPSEGESPMHTRASESGSSPLSGEDS